MYKNTIAINKFYDNEIYNYFFDRKYFDLIVEKNNGFYLQWLSDNQKPLITTYFINEGNGVFSSPSRGTFGGFGIANHRCSILDIAEFVSESDTLLREKGAKNIKIKLPPISHDPSSISVTMLQLLNLGYRVSGAELNYSMDVNNINFDQRVEYGNKKRINKCVKFGIEASMVGLDLYSEVYNVIKINRESKGYPVTLSYLELKKFIDKIPEKFVFFKAENSGVIVASAICIRISDDILYVFYWGDIPGYQEYSPVVLIAKEIYKYCQENYIKIIDIGTSSVNGIVNLGLSNFKKRLGFVESLKFNLEKNV
jgi:hypothetical protein